MDEEVGNDLGVSPEAGVCAVSDTARVINRIFFMYVCECSNC